MGLSGKMNDVIGPYTHKAAGLLPYDLLYPEVAVYVSKIIETKINFITVEHIGSTAVNGCDGKGIVDLMVIYPEGFLEKTKEALSGLGFQAQPHREPFSEERPMRVGSILYKERLFQLHVHVIQENSEEIASTLKFQDMLGKDEGLRNQYISCKRHVLKTVSVDSLDYCKAKGLFVEKVLGHNIEQEH
jgi:GrpB-like predicted nucleotidyltransferase (UPF0157 family)